MSPCSHMLARPGVAQCPSCGQSLGEPQAAPAPEPTLDQHVEVQEVRQWTAEERWLAAKVKRATESLAWFVRESWDVLEPITALEWGPHLQAVCDHVQWLLEDWIRAKKLVRYYVRKKLPVDMAVIKRMQRAHDALFWLPPGSLKTRIILECAPAWMWLRMPSWSVRCISMNPKRALDSARNMRQIIESPWYQLWFRPDWTLRDDRDAVGDFGNTAGGFRRSSGMSAEIIGTRTDAIFMDDPNDRLDDEDALTKANEKWDKEIFDRVNDLRIDVHIIVQQRVDVGDLSGHVLEPKDGNVPDWMVLMIPLHFAPDRARATVYGWSDWRTEAGDVFHARYTPTAVQKLRELYGPQFEAICEQHPEKGDGDHFKMAWWKFWRLETDRTQEARPVGCTTDMALVVGIDRFDGAWAVDKVVVTVDPTGASEKEDASHVGLLGCVNVGKLRLVVEDFGRGPRSYPDMLSDVEVAVIRMANLTKRTHVHLLIEKTALGPALCAEIEMRVKAATLRDADGRAIAVTIEDYKTGAKSKESRGKALEVPISVGEVHVRQGAQWLAPFFAEFKRFPKKPNDKVDALAQYVDHYRQKATWRDAMRNMRGAQA